jgi:hypothetical protein
MEVVFFSETEESVWRVAPYFLSDCSLYQFSVRFLTTLYAKTCIICNINLKLETAFRTHTKQAVSVFVWFFSVSANKDYGRRTFLELNVKTLFNVLF